MKKQKKLLLLVCFLLFGSQLFVSCNPPREPQEPTAKEQAENGLRIFDKD